MPLFRSFCTCAYRQARRQELLAEKRRQTSVNFSTCTDVSISVTIYHSVCNPEARLNTKLTDRMGKLTHKCVDKNVTRKKEKLANDTTKKNKYGNNLCIEIKIHDSVPPALSVMRQSAYPAMSRLTSAPIANAFLPVNSRHSSRHSCRSTGLSRHPSPSDLSLRCRRVWRGMDAHRGGSAHIITRRPRPRPRPRPRRHRRRRRRPDEVTGQSRRRPRPRPPSAVYLCSRPQSQLMNGRVRCDEEVLAPSS